jgi:hypothetical protein
VAPVSAEDIQARLAKAYATPQATLEPIRAAYGK